MENKLDWSSSSSWVTWGLKKAVAINMSSEYLEFDLICHNLLLHFQEED